MISDHSKMVSSSEELWNELKALKTDPECFLNARVRKYLEINETNKTNV